MKIVLLSLGCINLFLSMHGIIETESALAFAVATWLIILSLFYAIEDRG